MASALLSSITGGVGGIFVPSFTSTNLETASGVTGDILVLTPPSGERVELVMLYNSSAIQSGISIKLDGIDVITEKDLDDGDGVAVIGAFTVGSRYGTSSSSPHVTPSIIGGVDEVLTVTKNAGNTTQTQKYIYRFGGLK